MEIALLTIDVHLPYAQSLKDKREVVRQLKDRLRAKFNCSVAEVDANDLWQVSKVAVVTVNSDHVFLEKTMSAIEREAERTLAGNNYEFHREFL
jgi:uncharacterized protein YlxP (DUF503 family)